MAEVRGGSVAVWTASLILAGIFVLVGVNTLINPATQQLFSTWGYYDWVRQVVGVLEIGAGVMLLVRQVAWIGAVTLALIMIGGIVTFLRYNSLIHAAIPGLLLISLTSLAYHRFPRSTPPPPA